MENKVVIFWFRRDLRLNDNTGLAKALSSGYPVLPIFIFDPHILDKLMDKYDRRVDYMHQGLTAMNMTLHMHGSSLQSFHGTPLEVFAELMQKYDVKAVYCNRDYEPKAIERDTEIYDLFQKEDAPFKAYKDQVIFDKNDVLKNDGTPYTVYTPYAKKWKESLTPKDYQAHKVDFKNFAQVKPLRIHSLKAIGFEKTDMFFETPKLDVHIIKDYHKYRDFPALLGSTYLGVALRFGTISVRKCVDFALKHNDVWLSELIWREFFIQILYHFPRVVSESFKKQYDQIRWRNNEEEFERWCKGETGYPIVDAGMRQLNETGYMHNRVRMITASFLCKHLLIDWRWGEAYFAQKLNDYDLSANNGNWQWAAGCGCDAAPYFRIFNPTTQTQKFDKEHTYIRRWNPQYERDPRTPIVQHEIARKRALETYKRGIQSK